MSSRSGILRLHHGTKWGSNVTNESRSGATMEKTSFADRGPVILGFRQLLPLVYLGLLTGSMTVKRAHKKSRQKELVLDARGRGSIQRIKTMIHHGTNSGAL